MSLGGRTKNAISFRGQAATAADAGRPAGSSLAERPGDERRPCLRGLTSRD